LKSKGYKLVSTALREDTIDISKFNFMDSQNYVIILGNEGKGIRDEIILKSDYLVKIPIQEIDSLNVSIAGAIIMFKSRGY
jgi:TrmH family RNA methyltransferase